MRKKYLFYALLASSVLAAGCGKSNTQTATESTSSQEAVQSETFEGRISSISDSEITIETRQMGNPPEQGCAGAPGAPGNSENGAPDDANGTDSSSGNSNSQNTPPEKPDGNNGRQPDDQNSGKPDGQPGNQNDSKPNDQNNGKPGAQPGAQGSAQNGGSSDSQSSDNQTPPAAPNGNSEN